MDQTKDLERLRNWLATYPGYDLKANMMVDWIDKIPGSKSIMPGGLVETSRSEDILGNVTAENQYNFGLYIAVEKAPGDGVGAEYNAQWVLDFQRWVQQQSATHQAPTFGSIDQAKEAIKAQNGELYDTSDEGIGLYVIALSANFKTRYEVS